MTELFETIYITASTPEESRYPKFNIVATSHDIEDSVWIGRRWSFDKPRAFSVIELHRLSPVADIKKSAIWITWCDRQLQIEGLVDLGTSWDRARIGLGYQYKSPECLLAQVARPGKIRVYQGRYHIASLADGVIEESIDFDMHIALHEPANRALEKLAPDFIQPTIETSNEYEDFQFVALWNTYAAIANIISLSGHGGAIFIAPTNLTKISDLLKMKYGCSSSALRSAFIKFINHRNIVGDLVAQANAETEVNYSDYEAAVSRTQSSFEELIEATRFVSRMAEYDGAIIITEDLKLIGFGAEIRAESKV